MSLDPVEMMKSAARTKMRMGDLWYTPCPKCGVAVGSCETSKGDFREEPHKARALAAGRSWPQWWRPSATGGGGG